jgi:hypothetical protein
MKRAFLAICLLTGLLWIPCRADLRPDEPPHITDNYDISFGPSMDACLGDPQYFVPIKISVSRFTVRVNLIITYDPVVLTPTLMAPNMFFQSFTYDLSMPGKIKMSLVTDLPPPPVVPPLRGDTTIAWISFVVSTRDIGYDFLTHFGFYEDPVTPYPDNFIVLETNDRVTPPLLVLHSGDMILKHPLYGDINLNTYPYEIADAVLFLNFFNGRAHFNRCQYANSDCNRDGAQATIADLVFLLLVVTEDSILVRDWPDMPLGGSDWEPSGAPLQTLSLSPSGENYDIMIQNSVPVGGASFIINLTDNNIIPDAVVLAPEAAYMQMYCNLEDNYLRVTIVNWEASNNTFTGGKLFSLHFDQPEGPSGPPFGIESADFSDNNGQQITPDYYLKGAHSSAEVTPPRAMLTLSGYPNPFNRSTLLSFNLPDAGRYQMAIFDILGRKVKTLINGYQPAGSGQIIWDGSDEAGGDAASGTYFVRLQGDTKVQTIKLSFLK